MPKYPVLFTVLLLVFISSPLFAANSNKNLQLRIDRLERMLENNSQYQLLSKIKQLKEENRELRGLVEEQSNLIRKLERRIHSLYSDMDRRLVAVETDTSKILSSRIPQSETSTATTKRESKKTQPTNTPKVVETIKQNKPKNVAEKKPQETPNAADNSSKLLAEKQYDEQKAYQKAFEQLKALRYSKAQKSFSEFLKQYPDGRYAHIAQYWLAESNYAQRKFKLAIKDYQKLLSNHKTSPKKAEAYLKIAYCHYELGNKRKTREALNTLIKRYPNTTESGQAKRLLKRL